MSENIIKYTSLTVSNIKKLDSFFKNQNLEIKIDIFLEKRNEFFKIKNLNQSAEFSALDIASFYLAINNFYKLKEKSMTKNKTMSTSEIKKFNDYTIKASISKQKSSKKEDFLLDKSSIIIDLIAKKRSFREISKYLQQYHKTKISHTYIKQIIEKYPLIFNKKSEN